MSSIYRVPAHVPELFHWIIFIQKNPMSVSVADFTVCGIVSCILNFGAPDDMTA